jgi:hypothetical protein
MSNLLLVNDALSLIGVLPSGQDASAEDGELSLRTLNEMVEEWEEDGITVNWSAESLITDDCTLSGTQKTAVKHHLAIRLCPHFGREPSQTLVVLAQAAYSKLQRKQMTESLSEVKVPLPLSEGRGGWTFWEG